MSQADGARLRCECPFYYLAKFDGDRGPRPAATGNEAADLLAAIQADLMDPNCTELVVGSDRLSEPLVWRK